MLELPPPGGIEVRHDRRADGQPKENSCYASPRSSRPNSRAHPQKKTKSDEAPDMSGASSLATTWLDLSAWLRTIAGHNPVSLDEALVNRVNLRR